MWFNDRDARDLRDMALVVAFLVSFLATGVGVLIGALVF